MGGRGTFAAGNNVDFTYKTVGFIEGVKVLEGMGKKHDLPVEAHSSFAYIKLHPDGTLNMIRFYNKDKYLILEIAYHSETKLEPNRKPILHIHEYNNNINQFHRGKARLLSLSEYEKYKKIFKQDLHWIPDNKK